LIKGLTFTRHYIIFNLSGRGDTLKKKGDTKMKKIKMIKVNRENEETNYFETTKNINVNKQITNYFSTK